jgi:hypothetical protein
LYHGFIYLFITLSDHELRIVQSRYSRERSRMRRKKGRSRSNRKRREVIKKNTKRKKRGR